MEKKWIWITAIIICSILILCIIFTIVLKNKKESVPFEEEGTIGIGIEVELKEVDNKNNFYMVKSCINKFYTYYTAMYNSQEDNYIIDDKAKASIKKLQEQNANKIYNMLDTEYIKTNEITKQNILTKLEKQNVSSITITNMYVSQRTENIYIYIVKGKLREKVTNKITDFSIMLKMDSENRTFTILLQDYIKEHYSDVKVGEKFDIAITKNIEKNEDNTYDYITVSDETYVTDLFNQYKEQLLYNPDLAYENLDNEYKVKRFGDIEKFKTYTKENTKKHVIMQIDKYQKIDKDATIEYICVDQKGNYYIFKENAIMKYSVILDTYTLDSDEFIEKYNQSLEEEKVLLNIQKIFDAINLKDYTYAYKKLDQTFKDTYFKTEEEFKKYIEENWYQENKVNYGKCEKNQETYIYDISIKNIENEDEKEINKKIVMQLKEGTDFVYSFNINENN